MAAEEAISNGITTFHDMGETFAIVDLFKTMADEGNLPLRLYVAIDKSSEIMAQNLTEYRMVGYGNGYLTARTIGERVLDGALGTHGGWLLEPGKLADITVFSRDLMTIPEEEILSTEVAYTIIGRKVKHRGAGT